MKYRLLPLACALAMAPMAAQAQVSLHLDIGLPVAPPLVQVQPGIQVVEGFHDEVFFSAGWYWCRRPDGWYRARGPRASFDWVDRRSVPPGLVRMPAGRYRDWRRGGPGPGPGHRMEGMHGGGAPGPERQMEGPGRHMGGPGQGPGRGPGMRKGMRPPEP